MGKRLFIGIKIKPDEQLYTLMYNLKKSLMDSEVAWVKPDNLHLTLMFLGSVEIIEIEKIIGTLNQISVLHNSFDLKLWNIGNFKRKGKTNIIWIGIKDGNLLEKLAQDIIHGMRKHGFQTMNDKFSPHLTIGRVKSKCREDLLSQQIEFSRNKVIQTLYVKEIYLFESILKPGGPFYKIIERFQFKRDMIG